MGPAQGGENLGKFVTFSQIGAPSRTGIADVRPCLSDLRTPTERNERRGSVKERRSELLAFKQEVVRRVDIRASRGASELQ